jgi:hypothetical protein
MEDDCAPTKWYTPIFEVPDDADAVYVGTSIRGLTSDWKYKNFKTDTIWHGKPNLVNSYYNTYKVTNMLSTHAILYITKKYKEKVIQTMQMCIDKGGYNDMAISRIQKQFNVYANKIPTFYQSNEFNIIVKDFDVELMTKVKITDDLSIKPIEGIRKMNVTDLKVVYICPDHNPKYNKRKQHMDTMLSKIGFKDIIHYKSGIEAYPSCLAKAVKTVLSTYMNEPVLLIEDDVEYIDIKEFDYVEEADAIYFGLSWRGGHLTKNYHSGYATFRPYSQSQVRVVNMLGGHAILFISRKYKEAVINAMDNCLETGTYNDVAMSRIQRNYLILANNIPSFYQSLNFNEEQWVYYEKNLENVQSSTKIRITDKLTTEQI